MTKYMKMHEDRERLTARIKKHEGLKLKPYMDSLGFITIGYGRCLDKRGISKDEAEELLEKDIDDAIVDAPSAIGEDNWRDLDRMRRSVIVEMVFQIGVKGVSKFGRMIEALARKDYDAAADEMLDSRWHSQTPQRAETLAKIMRQGGEEV